MDASNIVNIYANYISFVEELAVVAKDEAFGYVNCEGELVISYNYDLAYDFSEGLALACIDNNYGYIDQHGDVVIPLCYKYAYSFSDGLTLVSQNGHKFFIDSVGNRVDITNKKRLEADFKIIQSLGNLATDSMAFTYDFNNQSIVNVRTWNLKLQVSDSMGHEVTIEQAELKDFQKRIALY